MNTKSHDNSVELSRDLIKHNVSKNQKLKHYLIASALILSTSTVLASKLPDTFNLETINCKLFNKEKSDIISYTLRMREPIYGMTAGADALSLQFVVRSDNFHPYTKQLLSSSYRLNNNHYYSLPRGDSQITTYIAEYAVRGDATPIWYAQRVTRILPMSEIEGPIEEWIWVVGLGTDVNKLYYSCNTAVKTILVDDTENQRP